MACGALVWSGLVEEHCPFLDQTCCFVAGIATDVQMPASQWEIRARLVVEQGGFPFVGVVALRASGAPAVSGKLVGVRIFVTALAAGGRRRENHILHCQFQVRRLVTARAGNGAMRSHEREHRDGMIESDDVRPGFGGMTGFAAGRFAIRSRLFHPLRELAVVRVDVAADTANVVEAVRNRQ